MGKTESFGWTQLDLFELKQLKRGKWKCPIYHGPTDPSINIAQIQDLQPISGAWGYLRIALPGDDELGKLKSLYPETAMGEYVVPKIHLRGRGRREDGGRMIGGGGQSNVSLSAVGPGPDKSSFTNNASSFKKLPEFEPTQTIVSESRPESSIQSASQTQQTFLEDGEKRGITITIHGVKNHIAKSHLRAMVATLEGNQLIYDEFGNPCVFNTSIHNPLEEGGREGGRRVTTRNWVENEDEIGNKSVGQDIVFAEEYKFFRNFRGLIRKNKNKTDLYLGIQVVEKPEPSRVIGNNADISYKTNNDTANYGGLEFELFGWLFFKLNNSDGSLRTGIVF